MKRRPATNISGVKTTLPNPYLELVRKISMTENMDE